MKHNNDEADIMNEILNITIPTLKRPTLTQLQKERSWIESIEALIGKIYIDAESGLFVQMEGSTPEEAVANLWLDLNTPLEA